MVNQGNATHCIAHGNSFIPAKTTETQILLDKYHSPLYLECILDLGSPVSFIIKDCSLLEPVSANESFVGMNKSAINVLGYIKGDMTIHNFNLTVNFYVVSNDAMFYKCLLGRDVLYHHNVKVTIHQGNIQFEPVTLKG